MAVGGLAVATGGVAGSFIAGSATTTIPLLGMTGAQTFAIGILCYNSFAVTAAMLGMTIELVEY